MTAPRDFWSQRRAAVEAEAAADAQAADARAAQARQAAYETRDDAEILAELNLTDPDDLQPGDDITGFMARAVPDRLRRRALRKLWRLNPVLANVDGLVDYGEDFTDASCVVENLQTAYQVGKGMMAHVEELARQAETMDDAAQADAMPAPAEELALSEREADPEPETAVMPDQPDPEPQPDLTDPAPRRMRFAFEG